MNRSPVLAAALAASLSVLAPTAVAPVASAVEPAPRAARADVALQWFDTTADAVATFASPVQAPSSALWATTWSAGDRALDRADVAGLDERAAGAAFATALHDVLVRRVPAAEDAVEAQLERTLRRVPEGDARDLAEKIGHRAARTVLRERRGDGLAVADVNTAYTPHGGAGYWVTTTPGAAPVQASLGEATPYLLTRLPKVPAPPALGTPEYRESLTEVRTLGSKTSAARSAAQTEVALFWGQSSLAAYTQVLRGLLEQQATEPLGDRVHLVAVFHEVTTDVQIATYAAKYQYERWRPITAIREADLAGAPLSDGDAATAPDPSWTPLITTPLHPEYPAGHVSYAAAATAVLSELVGRRADEPIAVTSTTAPGVERTYRGWAKLQQENLDGRVWEGVHFRFAGEASEVLGAKVARLALKELDARG